MKRNSVFGLVLCCLLLVTCFLGVRHLYKRLNPSFRTVAVTDSPDGRYRHTVELKDPPLFARSPYIYRFRVIDLRTSKVVEESESNADSCVYPDFAKPHQWSDEEIRKLNSTVEP